MTAYVAVKCGVGKKQCEDTVLVGKTLVSNGMVELSIPASGIICVADGVGGNAGGHIASTYIAEKLKSFTTFGPDIDISKLHQRLEEINAALISDGQKGGFPTMATTLTGLIWFNKNMHLVHVGNTRAYVLQGHYLKQLTIDHTVYNRLLKMGRIDDVSQCRKNEITSCLGGGNVALSDSLSISEVQEFNTMILTSDGVHDFISLDELESLLTKEAKGIDMCNSILQAAIRAGSEDDMSIAIIRK